MDVIDAALNWTETNFPPSNKTACDAGINNIVNETDALFKYVNGTDPADLNISTIIDYLFNLTGDI